MSTLFKKIFFAFTLISITLGISSNKHLYASKKFYDKALSDYKDMEEALSEDIYEQTEASFDHYQGACVTPYLSDTNFKKLIRGNAEKKTFQQWFNKLGKNSREKALKELASHACTQFLSQNIQDRFNRCPENIFKMMLRFVGIQSKKKRLDEHFNLKKRFNPNTGILDASNIVPQYGIEFLRNLLDAAITFFRNGIKIINLSENMLIFVRNFDLPNLKEIDLSKNCFSIIPTFKLLKLHRLNLRDNPLNDIPEPSQAQRVALTVYDHAHKKYFQEFFEKQSAIDKQKSLHEIECRARVEIQNSDGGQKCFDNCPENVLKMMLRFVGRKHLIDNYFNLRERFDLETGFLNASNIVPRYGLTFLKSVIAAATILYGNDINTIYLSENNLKTFKSLNFPNLEVLDLSHNVLKKIPDVTDYPHLRVLILSNNKIKKARNFKHPNLTVLELRDNPLSSNSFYSNAGKHAHKKGFQSWFDKQHAVYKQKALYELAQQALLEVKSEDRGKQRFNSCPENVFKMMLQFLNLEDFDTLVYTDRNDFNPFGYSETKIPFSMKERLNQEAGTLNLSAITPTIGKRKLKDTFYAAIALYGKHTKTLDLSLNDLTTNDMIELSAFLNNYYLPNLEVLKICKNELDRMPNFTLSRLRVLDVSGNKIKSIPPLDLPCLRELIISWNYISEIAVCDLPNLEILDLFQNKIKSIENLLHLQTLRILNLGFNKLACVPDMNFPRLIELFLNNNGLSEIPNFRFIRQLKVLDVSRNKLCRVPPLNYLQNLKNLNLGWNLLSKTPDFKLKSLTHLYLSNNFLTKVHDFELENLMHLYLNHNLLSELPDFQFLPNLRKLKFNCNPVKKEELVFNNLPKKCIYANPNDLYENFEN